MKNPLTQKINSWLGLCLVGVFGLFMTTKIIDFMHADNPLVDAIAATQGAEAGNY